MSIPVFFTPAMVANAASYSPSAGKPAQVLASWRRLGLPLNVVAPEPVSAAQLCLAHDADFVHGVLGGERANGFGHRLSEVAASLPFTSGAMLAAAREALRNGRGAVAPCSGFHHAGFDFAGGFCTFNGLMVTACSLLQEQGVKRLAILDLDMHFGNGTQDILDRLGLHDQVAHHSGATSARRAQAWLAALPELVTRLCTGSELLMYQAGADSHVDDPLGGYLTTAQMAQRDATVFAVARAMGVPVVWNLAGGYQRGADGGIRPVLDLHDNTLRAFARECMGLPVPWGASQDPAQASVG